MEHLLRATALAEARHFWFRGFRRFVTPLLDTAAAGRAELQLLELEELTPEHRESVERCIGLCRRVITIVRERVPPTLE